MRNDFESNYLMHHGIKGQKWGVRRYQNPDGSLTSAGKERYGKNETEFAKTSPKRQLGNGDYLYRKGTIAGRFGSDSNWNQNSDITYLYTNQNDRSVYSKRLGGDELIYKFKKDVKMPFLTKQYTDLLDFVKNDKAISNQYNYAKDEPFDFWKDTINQGGEVANRYYSSMKNKGYDALIDFRNVGGVAEDPIIILSPKDSLELIKKNDHLAHHGILGMKWGKKNGPPYPLGESQKSAAEKKSELPNDGEQKPIHNSDESVTFKKGYKFNRVGGENLQANSSGGLYVSYGKADAARYVKFLGPTLLGKLMGEYGTTIQHLSVKDDLKCISDSSIVKETMQFLKKNPQFLKDVGDSFYSLAFEDLKIDDRSLDAYNDKEKKQINYLVNSLLGDPNYSDLAKSYYGYFRSKGYDAIPDVHDRLSGTGETAMIIINPQKISMTAKTTITKDTMKEAKAFVKSVGDLPIDELLK